MHLAVPFLPPPVPVQTGLQVALGRAHVQIDALPESHPTKASDCNPSVGWQVKYRDVDAAFHGPDGLDRPGPAPGGLRGDPDALPAATGVGAVIQSSYCPIRGSQGRRPGATHSTAADCALASPSAGGSAVDLTPNRPVLTKGGSPTTR